MAESDSILTHTEATLIINNLALNGWGAPPHSYNDIKFMPNVSPVPQDGTATGEIQVLNGNNIVLSIGKKKDTQYGSLWYMSYQSKGNKASDTFVTSNNLINYLKKNVVALMTGEMPLEKEKEKPHLSTITDSGFGAYSMTLPSDYKKMSELAGFKVEEKQKNMVYVHASGEFQFQYFPGNGLCWSSEEGTKEWKLDDVNKVIDKALVNSGESMTGLELEKVFTNAAKSRESELMDKMFEMADKMNGENLEKTQPNLHNELKNKGFSFLSGEENFYVNQELLQIVVVNPTEGNAMFHFLYISPTTKTISHSVYENVSKLMVAIGSDGEVEMLYQKIKQQRKAETDKQVTDDILLPSDMNYNSDAGQFIQLNTHDNNIMLLAGFKWTFGVNEYQHSDGTKVAFHTSGNAYRKTPKSGKGDGVKTSIPGALIWVVNNYISKINKKEDSTKSTSPFSNQDYNINPNDDQLDNIKLNEQDTEALDKINFHYDENNESYVKPLGNAGEPTISEAKKKKKGKKFMAKQFELPMGVTPDDIAKEKNPELEVPLYEVIAAFNSGQAIWSKTDNPDQFTGKEYETKEGKIKDILNFVWQRWSDTIEVPKSNGATLDVFDKLSELGFKVTKQSIIPSLMNTPNLVLLLFKEATGEYLVVHGDGSVGYGTDVGGTKKAFKNIPDAAMWIAKSKPLTTVDSQPMFEDFSHALEAMEFIKQTDDVFLPNYWKLKDASLTYYNYDLKLTVQILQSGQVRYGRWDEGANFIVSPILFDGLEDAIEDIEVTTIPKVLFNPKNYPSAILGGDTFSNVNTSLKLFDHKAALAAGFDFVLATKKYEHSKKGDSFSINDMGWGKWQIGSEDGTNPIEYVFKKLKEKYKFDTGTAFEQATKGKDKESSTVDSKYGPISLEEALNNGDNPYYKAPEEWFKYQPYAIDPDPNGIQFFSGKYEALLKGYGLEWVQSKRMYCKNWNTDGWEGVKNSSSAYFIYFYPSSMTNASMTNDRRYFISKDVGKLIHIIEGVQATLNASAEKDHITPKAKTEIPWSGFDYADWGNKEIESGNYKPNDTIQLLEPEHEFLHSLGYVMEYTGDKKTPKFSNVYFNPLNPGEYILFYVTGASIYKSEGEVTSFKDPKSLIEWLKEGGDIPKDNLVMMPKDANDKKGTLSEEDDVISKLEKMGFILTYKDGDIKNFFFKQAAGLAHIVSILNNKRMRYKQTQDVENSPPLTMIAWEFSLEDGMQKLKHDAPNLDWDKLDSTEKKVKSEGEVPYSGTDYPSYLTTFPGHHTIALFLEDSNTLESIGFKLNVLKEANPEYKYAYANGSERMFFYADGTAKYWPNEIGYTKQFDTVKAAMQFLWDKQHKTLHSVIKTNAPVGVHEWLITKGGFEYVNYANGPRYTKLKEEDGDFQLITFYMNGDILYQYEKNGLTKQEETFNTTQELINKLKVVDPMLEHSNYKNFMQQWLM